MKIQKTYQGAIPLNRIANEYDESDINTYSTNYINNSTNNVKAQIAKIEDDLDLYGSTAVFYMNDTTQPIPQTTTTRVLFNSTQINENDCFELLSDGSIKVLKDISKVLVSFNVRGGFEIGKYYYLGIVNKGDCVNASPGPNAEMANGSGVLSIEKNDIIYLTAYYQSGGGYIHGWDQSWCGIRLTVLK